MIAIEKFRIVVREIMLGGRARGRAHGRELQQWAAVKRHSIGINVNTNALHTHLC